MLNINTRLVTQTIVALGLICASVGASAQNWTKQSDMKVARVEATTVDYRGDIYVFNGFKAGIRIADSIEKYNAATKKWSIIGSTSTMNGTAVTHNGVVRVGADVWIIGGRIGSHPGRVSDKVWIYNLGTKKWRRGPDLPTPGAAGGAALVNNKIHWFGGIDANARCDVNNHYTYDFGKPAAGWTNITAKAGMPSPRNHFSTAVVNGIVYAMGGQYGHDNCPGKSTQDTTLVQAFNPKTNKWSVKASLPSKNSHTEPGTFVYKGDIYTIGGENAGDKVWKYNPKSNKWSTFKTLPEKLVAPIARIIDGNLVVAGGGAPIARNAVNGVRSIRVDNNPPAVTVEPEPIQEPEPEVQPEPAPEPVADTTPVAVQAPVVEQAPEPEPTPVPGSGTPKKDTLISMEAEYFDIREKTSTHQWVHATLGNSSNDAAMVTTPDEGQLAGTTKNTPMLSYMVYFNSPGKHYVWIRGLGDSSKSGVGNSDSIRVGLNGKLADTAYRIDQFPNQWTWSRHTPSNPVASLNVVNAGVNMVNLWMREDGLAIDKFIITSDPKFAPTGFGPDVTDGTDDFVPPVIVVDEAPVASTTIDEPVESDVVVDAPRDANPVIDDAVEPNSVTNDTVVTESNEAVVSELVREESVVVVAVVDETTDPDTTETDDSVAKSDEDEVVSALPAAINTDSSNGVFGGSASSTTLLGLLVIFLLRVSRSRTVMQA